MQNKPSALVVAAFGLGPLLLAAGCGGTGSDSSDALLVPVQSSSYVTIEAATTSTTTIPVVVGDIAAGEVSPVQQEYTVVSNDSVSKIAGLYNITMDVLVNFNAWPEGTSHSLQVGDKVLIPPNAIVPGTATNDTTAPATDGGGETATPTVTSAPAAGTACQHTVVENDNPTRVAKQYGITVDELAAANNGNPAYSNFLLGSKLNIPANGSC
ncbi:MAG: LysM peptidoglycan-binding domain-containing protein [Ilumatobacteraceae bacterium]